MKNDPKAAAEAVRRGLENAREKGVIRGWSETDNMGAPLFVVEELR